MSRPDLIVNMILRDIRSMTLEEIDNFLYMKPTSVTGLSPDQYQSIITAANTRKLQLLKEQHTMSQQQSILPPWDTPSSTSGQLTELQQTLLLRRMAGIMSDFDVQGILVLHRDGTKNELGTTKTAPIPEVSAKPPRKRRTLPEGYKLGTLSTLCRPWLELAVAFPDETIIIRLEDIQTPEVPTLNLRQFLCSLSSLAVARQGKGRMTTRLVRDVNGEEVAQVTAHKNPTKRDYHTSTYPQGKQSPGLYAGKVTPSESAEEATASRYGAGANFMRESNGIYKRT